MKKYDDPTQHPAWRTHLVTFDQLIPQLKEAYIRLKFVLGNHIGMYTEDESINASIEANCYTPENETDPEWNKTTFFHVLDIYKKCMTDDDCIIHGAYFVELSKEGKVEFQWQPYPEDPIIGVENFIDHIYEHHEQLRPEGWVSKK